MAPQEQFRPGINRGLEKSHLPFQALRKEWKKILRGTGLEIIMNSSIQFIIKNFDCSFRYF